MEHMGTSWLGKRSTLREEELIPLLDHVRRGLRPLLELLSGIQLVCCALTFSYNVIIISNTFF